MDAHFKIKWHWRILIVSSWEFINILLLSFLFSLLASHKYTAAWENLQAYIPTALCSETSFAFISLFYSYLYVFIPNRLWELRAGIVSHFFLYLKQHVAGESSVSPESWLCHLPAVWTCTWYLSAAGFSFLIRKARIISPCQTAGNIKWDDVSEASSVWPNCPPSSQSYLATIFCLWIQISFLWTPALLIHFTFLFLYTLCSSQLKPSRIPLWSLFWK